MCFTCFCPTSAPPSKDATPKIAAVVGPFLRASDKDQTLDVTNASTAASGEPSPKDAVPLTKETATVGGPFLRTSDEDQTKRVTKASTAASSQPSIEGTEPFAEEDKAVPVARDPTIALSSSEKVGSQQDTNNLEPFDTIRPVMQNWIVEKQKYTTLASLTHKMFEDIERDTKANNYDKYANMKKDEAVCKYFIIDLLIHYFQDLNQKWTMQHHRNPSPEPSSSDEYLDKKKCIFFYIVNLRKQKQKIIESKDISEEVLSVSETCYGRDYR